MSDFTGESWTAGVGLPPAPSSIVEAQCRRPHLWTEGPPVPLAGGLVLHLPRLAVSRLRPFPLMRALAPDLPGKLAAWDAALVTLSDAVNLKGQPDAPDIVDSVNALDVAFLDWLGDATTIAAGLLAWNYDLSAFDAAGLFPLDPEEQGETARALKAALGAEFQDWLSAQPGDPDGPEQDGGWDGSDSSTPPLTEHLRRRDCWTPGAPVPLAVGAGWRLPTLDLGVFLTVPGFRDEVLELFPLMTDARRRLAGLPDPADGLAVYRANGPYIRHVVRLAMILLRANYRLDDAAAARLLPALDSEDFAALFNAAGPPIGDALNGAWLVGLMPMMPAPGRDIAIN